jgi:NADH dehydrogenase
MAGQDVVINLVGILHGNNDKSGAPYGSDWQRAHVILPRNIIAAMKANQVKRYLHMSALGADSKGPSMYQRSKGDGEALVKATDLAWTIFRPSVVFGPGDKFLNTFAQLQRLAPVVPLAGATCKFQPVHVDDVAKAFVQAINRDESVGQTYELAGPEVFTLKELVQIAGRAAGAARPVIAVPEFVGRIQALMMSLMPGEPLLSKDNLDSMHVDNIIIAGKDGCTNLGIYPKALSASIDYLRNNAMSSPYATARAHAGR